MLRLMRHVLILYPFLATPNFWPDLYANPFAAQEARS